MNLMSDWYSGKGRETVINIEVEEGRVLAWFPGQEAAFLFVPGQTLRIVVSGIDPSNANAEISAYRIISEPYP